jgi:virginiamycin B lyase
VAGTLREITPARSVRRKRDFRLVVWFVGQRAGYLAHLNAETGEFSQVELKDGSGPHNLIVGSDGIVWYAGNLNRLIGRYDPETKEIEEIMMPDEAARDPHTLIFDADEENIWFTVQGGNMMGRLNIESRKVDLIKSRTPRSRPYGRLNLGRLVRFEQAGAHRSGNARA